MAIPTIEEIMKVKPGKPVVFASPTAGSGKAVSSVPKQTAPYRPIPQNVYAQELARRKEEKNKRRGGKPYGKTAETSVQVGTNRKSLNNRQKQKTKEAVTEGYKRNLEGSRGTRAYVGAAERFLPGNQGKELDQRFGADLMNRARDTTSYKAGEVVGTMAQYGTVYGLGAGAGFGKAVSALPQVQKLSPVGQAIARSTAFDTAFGTPLNYLNARSDGLKGRELAKNMALNAAIDFGVGGAMEAVPFAIKGIKGISQKQPILQPSGKVKYQTVPPSVETPSLYRAGQKENASVLGRAATRRMSYIKPEENIIKTLPAPKETVMYANPKGEINDSLDFPQEGPNYKAASGQREIPFRVTPGEMKRQGGTATKDSSYIKPETVSAEMIPTYKKFVESTDERVMDFARRSIAGEASPKANFTVSMTNNKEVDDLQRLLGIDVRTYTHNARPNAFQHIWKRHGLTGSQDRSMADLYDIGRIPYVLKEYDSVDFVRNAKNEIEYSKTIFNADGSKAPLIKFEKRINGHYYIVEAAATTKNKRLDLVSAYMQKAKKEPHHHLDAFAPRTTPNSESEISTPFNNMLHQGGNNVKNVQEPPIQSLQDNMVRGVLSGQYGNVKPEQIRQMDAIAKRSGVKIQIEDLPNGVEGTYRDGVITISKRAQNPVAETLKHELTHYIENSGFYKELADFIINNTKNNGIDVEGIMKQIAFDYADAGKMLDPNGINHEFVAKFCSEYLFNDEKSINRLARENPNLFTRIYEWITDNVKKLRLNPEGRFLIDAQRKYEKALRSVKEVKAGETQYLFAGENARKANLEKLAEAKAMKQSGEADEAIWKKTGWMKGPDGKWRFEIDDSKMTFHGDGYANVKHNPRIQRKMQLENKLADGSISVKEQIELRNLQNVYRRNRIADFVEHGELFDNYPELKSEKFRLEDLGSKGRYDEGQGITIRQSLNGEGRKRTTLHELQHAIQSIENFEYGGSPESALAIVRERAQNHLRTIGDETFKSLTRSGNTEATSRYIDNFILKQYNASNIKDVANQAYQSLLGEQEARMAMDRINLSPEERLNRLPEFEMGALTRGGDGYVPRKGLATATGRGRGGDFYSGISLRDGGSVAAGNGKLELSGPGAGSEGNNNVGRAGLNDPAFSMGRRLSEISPELEAMMSRAKIAGKKVPTATEIANSKMGKAGVVMDPVPDYKEFMDDQTYGEAVGGTGVNEFAYSLSGKGVVRSKDIQRNLDAATRGNPEARKWFRDNFETPFYQSKGKYAKDTKKQLDALYEQVVKGKGILKGSKESAAVQWIGEGQRIGRLSKNSNPVMVPYTLEDLKTDFSYKMPNGKPAWENIVESEKIIRKMYDDYVPKLNKTLQKIYPNVEKNVADIKRKAYKEKLTEGMEVQGPRGNKGTIQKIKEDGTYTVLFKNRETGNKALVDFDRGELMSMRKVQELEDAVVGKRLQPRKDYFRHFKELQGNFFKDLSDIRNSATNIDPRLIEVSEFTEPKSRYTQWLQRRKNGMDYTEDAVGGMLEYIPQAEYKATIEPNIPKLRSIVKDLQESTVQTRNANALIQQFMDLANDLAGKTNPIDRAILHLGADEKGRAHLKTMSKLSGRVRANAVVGNVNTILSQFYNMPNVVGYAKNPADVWRGMTTASKAAIGDAGSKAILDKSMFLRERYLDRSMRRFDHGVLSDINKFLSWSMELGDKAVADTAFSAYYGRAIKDGLSEADAVLKADELTRKAVAGRGIGEMPLTQKAEVVKLLVPFQVEVRNAVNVLKDLASAKDIGRIAGVFITTFLMNQLRESVATGSIGFDPIDVGVDAVKDVRSGEKTAGEGARDAAFGLTGELLSNYPGGSYIALAAQDGLGLDQYTVRKLFGENDPTRFGTGNMAVNTAGKLIGDALMGKDLDLLAPAMAFGPAYGGKQIERGIRGLQDMAVLPREKVNLTEGVSFAKQDFPASYSRAGGMRFAPERTMENYIKAPVFGSFATTQGKEYLNEGFKPLGEKQTQTVKEVYQYGGNPQSMIRAYNEIREQEITKKEDIIGYLKEHGFGLNQINAVLEQKNMKKITILQYRNVY